MTKEFSAKEMPPSHSQEAEPPPGCPSSDLDQQPIPLTSVDKNGKIRGDLPVVTVVLEFGDQLIPTVALDDTGAGANFISLSLAERIGFDLNWAKKGPPIKLGDNSNVPCYGSVRLTLRLHLTPLNLMCRSTRRHSSLEI